MLLRFATTQDIDAILTIIQQAKDYFKNHGIDQWQDGYPNRESTVKDIEQQVLHVLVDQQNIIGIASIIHDEDPFYKIIEQGNWITTSNDYIAIHRVAILPEYKGQGLASLLIQEAIQLAKKNQVKSLRADTHEDNHSMQHLLLKNGFQFCGIVHVDHHAKRLAYEKLID